MQFKFHIMKNINIILLFVFYFKCEDLLETYESDIEQWYFNDQTISLLNYLCKNRALKNSDVSCLNEAPTKGDTRRLNQEL